MRPRSQELVNANVACYARVSSEDQAERETVRAQIDFLERFTALQELPVAGFYVDDGISGAIPLEDRPEGRRLLVDAEAGRFGTVLVYRLDRLGRSLSALLAAHDRLDACGVAIRSGTEPFDTASPIGKFLFSLLGSMAELERSTIAERMARGRDRVAGRGKYTGGPIPLGYDLDADGCLVPSERPMPVLGLTEAEYVRDLFRRVAERSTTLAGEAERLTRLGVPRVVRYGGPRGRQLAYRDWKHAAITRVIHNTAYVGSYRVRSKYGTVERPCVPLVDDETWQRAQEATTANRTLSSKNAKRAYLLRGLVRCGTCGRAFVGTPGPHKRGQYRCAGQTGGRNGERCPAGSVEMADLDAIVWARVAAIVGDPAPYLAAVERRLVDRATAEAVPDRSAPLAAEIAAKAAERERVLGLHRRGSISAEEAERELDAIRRETDGLRDLLAGLRIEAEAQAAQRAYLTDLAALLARFAERVAEIDATDDRAGKREMIDVLVRRVVVRTEILGLARVRRRKRTSVDVVLTWDDDVR